MKKGEIVIINSIFGGEIRLPKMKGEDLYKVLTAKAEISSIVEDIQKKAEELKNGTKPESVDPMNFQEDDPDVIEWKKQFIPMQNKLYNEEYEGKFPDPCIPRDAFPDMIVGMSAGNAELLLKYLVVKEKDV